MIVIKNMKMPSSCYDCPFAKNERTNDYGSFCECGVLEDYETINLLEYSKHPNCPLIEKEPCEDYISREDAIMCMTGEYVADMTYKPEDIISKHIQRLRALPPVKPIRPKGHWIREKSVHGWDGRSYQCSVCGRSIHLDTAVEDLIDYPYCHCGSRNMR